jgi:hypothetical protein
LFIFLSVLFVFRIRRRRNVLRSFSNIVGEKPDLENVVLAVRL